MVLGCGDRKGGMRTGQLALALAVDEHVGSLDVSVHDLHVLVEMMKALDHGRAGSCDLLESIKALAEGAHNSAWP